MRKALAALLLVLGFALFVTLTLSRPSAADHCEPVGTPECHPTPAPTRTAPTTAPTATSSPAPKPPATTKASPTPADRTDEPTNEDEDEDGTPTPTPTPKKPKPLKKDHFCHVSAVQGSPYQSFKLTKPSDTEGHVAHQQEGPWHPGAKSEGFVWGDIIPPLPTVDGLEDGLNWTAAGKAIWANGCEIVAPSAATTIATCDSDGLLIMPVNDKTWSFTRTENDDGVVTVRTILTKNLKAYQAADDGQTSGEAQKWVESMEYLVTKVPADVCASQPDVEKASAELPSTGWLLWSVWGLAAAGAVFILWRLWVVRKRQAP